jgi:hypothetical protein
MRQALRACSSRQLKPETPVSCRRMWQKLLLEVYIRKSGVYSKDFESYYRTKLSWSRQREGHEASHLSRGDSET